MAHECECRPLQEVLASIDAAITDGKWYTIAVDGGRAQPSWAYTIGLTERFSHPELIVVGGCCLDCRAGVLQTMARRVADGERFDTGEVRFSVGRGDVHIGSVHPLQWHHAWFNMWRNYYESKPWDPPAQSALQVVLCPDRGDQPRLDQLVNRAARRRAMRRRPR